ncbi:hypothetical protein ZEAMMB73_Zm00001d007401 [Zea mays]|nr:hypothetical protein ZEAMMB73_Zm00001d007401 [Zea mays]ONM26732.1 hypothetical protein ZEAMMB73_Zm00001d007401 [Zea mays]ONM26745.1 hypothetical protein ZEAMMB73_Zm00001d007401 [Zea mays]
MEFYSFNLFPGTQMNLQLAYSVRSVSKRVVLEQLAPHNGYSTLAPSLPQTWERHSDFYGDMKTFLFKLYL